MARNPGIRWRGGGGAFRAKPGLWMDIGADGFAPDLNSAVELADRHRPFLTRGDVQSPGVDGVAGARAPPARRPGYQVVVLPNAKN